MAVKYIAKRFIDKFVPGEEVPADYYEQSVLDKMIQSGHIEQIVLSESAKRGRPKKDE